jgi:hypothetical protein
VLWRIIVACWRAPAVVIHPARPQHTAHSTWHNQFVRASSNLRCEFISQRCSCMSTRGCFPLGNRLLQELPFSSRHNFLQHAAETDAQRCSSATRMLGSHSVTIPAQESNKHLQLLCADVTGFPHHRNICTATPTCPRAQKQHLSRNATHLSRGLPLRAGIPAGLLAGLLAGLRVGVAPSLRGLLLLLRSLLLSLLRLRSRRLSLLLLRLTLRSRLSRSLSRLGERLRLRLWRRGERSR